MCIRDSLEGGGEGCFRYSASVQYNDVKGVMKGSNRETFNGNVDLVYELGSLLFRNSLEVGLSESNESSYCLLYTSFSGLSFVSPFQSSNFFFVTGDSVRKRLHVIF